MYLCSEFRKITNDNTRVDDLSKYVKFSLGKWIWDFNIFFYQFKKYKCEKWATKNSSKTKPVLIAAVAAGFSVHEKPHEWN